MPMRTPPTRRRRPPGRNKSKSERRRRPVSQREWIEKDFYKELGVSSHASADEIKKAYRKLARRYHPDANPGDAKAEERFKAIGEAYDTLSDPDRRKQYDSFGRTFRPGQGPGPGGGFQGFDFGNAGAGFDLGDLFGGLFNRGGRGGPSAGPRRGADVEA